ncbi:thiamine-phosphate kinase [Edaphobacter aggregans]|nr:thiamine-phosphate kinase [Edaphobacter aggregans]
MPSRPIGELALIEQIRQASSPVRNKFVTLGIGDDCAILRPPRGYEILVTTDFTLEDRHFRRALHPPESVGHRCLARGLSDLAAMGATPLAAFLSLALPATMFAEKSGQLWIDGFLRGLRELSEHHNVPLAGGDTSESPSRFILADIILIGSAPRSRALRRSTARPGDAIYVTGQLGGAAAELATILARKRRVPLPTATENHPHLFPEPRLDTGDALLRRNLATACIDISDGLSTDLAHLCRASNVAAEIEQTAIPIHPLARKLTPAAALKNALHGGEDYELLFTAAPTLRIPSSLAAVPITRIGTIKPKRPRQPLITLTPPDGTRSPLEPAGWEHFTNH